jgi:hypothetical protein
VIDGSNGSASVNDSRRPVIILGASHARNISEVLTSKGYKCRYLETPNWRAVSPIIQAKIAVLKRILQEDGMHDAIIIPAMLDNAFYLARYEDGAEIGIRRAVDGQYHIDGSLGYAPREKQMIIFTQLEPLLRTFSDNDKIMLMPLPRYLWESCCGDQDHGPNILEDGQVIEQLSSIDAAFKLWRGMAFRDKIGNLKLCNASHLILDESFWKDGPVHPSLVSLVSHHLLMTSPSTPPRECWSRTRLQHLICRPQPRGQPG